MKLGKMPAILACLLLLTPVADTFGQRRGTNVRRTRTASRARRRQATAQAASSMMSLNGLVTSLRAAGARVRRGGTVTQPFFSAKGHLITINREEAQVFEYPKAGTAEAEAKHVDPAGSSVGTNMMTWLAPPHFYRGGRLIVLYLGENPTVINALIGVMGSQFAGV